MSKKKFVFEWKVGDELILNEDVRVVIHIYHGSTPDLYVQVKGMSIWTYERSIDSKPHGHTKKRYKSEKLAWQQSRMKEGDWVKRIKGVSMGNRSAGYSGEKFQLGRVDSLGLFNEAGANCCHDRSNLKPCKPPKEKPAKIGKISPADLWAMSNYRRNIAGRVYSAPILVEWPYVEPAASRAMIRVESENFRIENDELVFTGSFMGERAWGSIFTQDGGEICLNTFDGMKISSEYCKEIGAVLDLYAAMDK